MKTREEVRKAVIEVAECVSEKGKHYNSYYEASNDSLLVYRVEAGTTAKIPIDHFYAVYTHVSQLNKTDQIKEIIGDARYRSPIKAILLNSSLYTPDGRRV